METKAPVQLGIAVVVTVAGLALLALLAPPVTQAQGGTIYVHKALGRQDPVVHVGEYLTFTIFIRNDTTFTVTTLPLSDEFNASVLGYADAIPAPDSVNSPTGHLEWYDLTGFFGNLTPGQGITVVVGFIAEHPQTAVVNRAWVHDAQGSQGDLQGGTSSLTDTNAIGGSSPVDKAMLGTQAVAGRAVTFTLTITNDSYTTMTVAPLVDRYDPTWLRFSYAVPMPDLTSAGVLTWTDLTLWRGDIPAHGNIVVTAVFTALGVTSNATHNRASVNNAADWFGNELGAGADDVPITIITAPLPPATATPTPRPATPPPTSPPATPTPFPTPVFTPTATPYPLLPSTGYGENYGWLLGLATVFIVLGGILTFSRR